MTCNALLPPEPGLDAFGLFGLEPEFALDLTLLERRQRELQKQLHPDLFAKRGATERRLSLEWTTRINEAAPTLTDPVARAAYLLTRLGWEARHSAPDPEFLEEVMERREILEEVDPLAPDALARLAALKKDARNRIETEVAQVAACFRTLPPSPPPASLLPIARLLDRMRYHRRYLEELERLEERAFEAE
ncbi:MAG: Fe-S protein assembly co-chaperone HscB [Magnetococcales bacterium]|nr:Fe-S protein assembly co-chaperone HscB [Magnetococcales bacterium]